LRWETVALPRANPGEVRHKGQSVEGGTIIDFVRPEAKSLLSFIDIKGHSGLGFWTEPQLSRYVDENKTLILRKATMLLKNTGIS